MVRKTCLSAAFLLHHALGAVAAPQKGSATLAADAPPATFTANPNIGPGGSNFKDSAHFRVYGAQSTSAADEALEMLEGAYECFVETLGWRSSGLSFNAGDDSGPWYKINIYSVDTLTNAAGVMHSDQTTGMAWLEVVHDWLTEPTVTVHEYGHGLHYHQQTWVSQSRTGAWWETLANWVADTYTTSDLCAQARANHGASASAGTGIDVQKLIGDSFQVIVDGTADSGNYYQAWPFLAYLTNNPDDFAGLGQDAVLQLQKQYEKNSNEDPLHTLSRVSTNATVADVVGRYWARMAYVDIGHPSAQDVFLQQRANIDFSNVQSQGGSYKVISSRKPLYMGSNIIPLQVSGSTVEVKVTTDGEYTGTLAVFNADTRASRYVTLVNGAGSVSVENGEEVSLVIAHTPSELVLFDGFDITGEVANGLDYSFTLSGATV